MKKIASILLVSLLVASVFAGCDGSTPAPAAAPTDSAADAPASAQASEPESKIQLTLGIWPEDTNPEEVQLHEGYKATFETSHPNIEVVPAAYVYAQDTFVPLAESGNLPVVFQPWFTEPQKLVKNGYVRDITDILKARGWDTAINPAIKDLLTADGKLYGIPRDGYALGVMINVSLFEEAGLVNADGTPQFPKTWEELATTGKTIKDKTGAAGLCLLAKDNAGGWHFSNIAWAFGATLCVPNGDGTFKSNLNTPEAIAAMSYVKDLRWTYDILTADPTNEDWGTGFSQLGTGNAAMYIAANDAVQMPTATNGLAVDKLALMSIPNGPGGKFMLSGGTAYMFAANATDEQVNAALDYIEIMGKAPTVSEISTEGMVADAKFRQEAGIPVIARFPAWINKELIDNEQKIIDEYSNVDMALYNDYFNATKTSGVLRTEEPGLVQDMYGELTKVLQAVLTDKNADVASLMETANNNYQTILDTNQ